MTQIHLKCSIPDSLTGQRLDRALAVLFPNYSRAQLQQWIKAGQVHVDGQILRQRDKVKAEQSIEIQSEWTEQTQAQAQPIKLNIVFEDASLLIVNKPAGLVTHPGAGNADQTLVNALLHHDPQLCKLPRAGLIHRLDKDTSGLLIVARDPSSYHQLTTQMQQREISREYEAIVKGVMISGGTVEVPIGRHPTQRTRMAVTPTGKSAVTHYRVIQRYRLHTRIRVRLESGRTHQIRVHLTHINYPLVGDPVYGKQRAVSGHVSDALKEILKVFKRQALHATRLSFKHPKTEEMLTFEAQLPEDMQNLIHVLEEDAID